MNWAKGQGDRLRRRRHEERQKDRPRDAAPGRPGLLAEISRRPIAVVGEDRHRHGRADGRRQSGMQRSAAHRQRLRQERRHTSRRVCEAEGGQDHERQKLHGDEHAGDQGAGTDVQHAQKRRDRHRGETRGDGGQPRDRCTKIGPDPQRQGSRAKEGVGQIEPQRHESRQRPQGQPAHGVFSARVGKRRRQLRIDLRHKDGDHRGDGHGDQRP
jgi:hypothetical protein